MAEEIIKVGQKAPDFTLNDESGTKVTLSALHGKPVLILFFPLAFSPVCEGEMCTIRDAWDDFAQAGATVLGISRDSTFALKAWKEQQGLKNAFLADMKGEVARRYGAWNEERGLAERLSVVVDKDGKVTYVTRSAGIPIARDQSEAIKAVRAAAA
ncbi:MAG: redoxin domain-containing protein [Dehalococcoidia bacterium]